MPITNWTEFFRKERDIYVQNVANAQVSLEFEISPGNAVGFLFPQTRNPINLTQHIPFQAIAGSVNFRRMLNRRPPVLQLLTEDEFNTYYQRRAVDWQLPSMEDAMDRAEMQRLGLQNRTAVVARPEEQPNLAKQEVVTTDEVIHPRVLHLCNQVGPEVKDSDKLPAPDMIDELEKVEADLKTDDLEYLRSKGYWKGVRKWAEKGLSRLANANVEADEE